ncbi:MAG: alpha/beta hydrolase [Pseudomonadota bacterium]
MFQTYAEAAAALARTGVAAADPLTQPIAEARERQDAYFTALNGELPAVADTQDLSIPGPSGTLPLRLVYPTRPSVGTPLPVIVFVRGAGFWGGALDSHARTMRSLALLTGCAVCGVDYRRTPEHRYPVQRDELLAALRWLRTEGATHGLQGTAPVLFGESAGATLCLSAALFLRDAGEPAPAGLVLFYTNAAGPKATLRPASQWVWQQYLGHEGQTADASAVPLLADLHGLPPMWLACGEDDPLMADTLALDEKLRAAGSAPTLLRYPALPHAFVMWTATLAPALAALGDAAAAARGFLGLGPAQPL